MTNDLDIELAKRYEKLVKAIDQIKKVQSIVRECCEYRGIDCMIDGVCNTQCERIKAYNYAMDDLYNAKWDLIEFAQQRLPERLYVHMAKR